MKKVVIKSNSVLFWNYPTIWDDFIISITDKPKHRKYSRSITISSMSWLKAETEWQKEYHDKDNDIYDSYTIDLINLLTSLDKLPYYITSDNHIIINKPILFKKDIEFAIDKYMKSLGFSGARCKWKKPNFVIQSAGPGWKEANEYLETLI